MCWRPYFSLKKRLMKNGFSDKWEGIFEEIMGVVLASSMMVRKEAHGQSRFKRSLNNPHVKLNHTRV